MTETPTIGSTGSGFLRASPSPIALQSLSIFWKRFTTEGAVWGLASGLLSSIALILISPSIMGVDAEGTPLAKRHLIQAAAIFPLTNPGIVSIPLGFLAAVIGTLLRREPSAEAKFTEFKVRAHTGLGAEKGGGH